MTTVVQLTKELVRRPDEFICHGADFRHFQGPEDIPLWLELRRTAFRRQRIGVRQWSEADFGAEFLCRWWWRPDRMWLAEAAGPDSRSAENAAPPTSLVGTVTLAFRGTEENPRPVVHWLLVHPMCRRQGIARALLSRLEACAWDLGYRQVWLETHVQWLEAAALYKALEYEPATFER